MLSRWVSKLSKPKNSRKSALNLPDETEDWQSVRAVSVSTDQNPKWRRTMEDEHVVLDKFGGEMYQGYFAVYDGHGGTSASEYLAQHLHVKLEEELKVRSEEEALKNTYQETDKMMLESNVPCGSTAISVLVRIKSDGRWLYTANCGDSRAVLCRDGKAVRLSVDHKPTDSEEKARIEALDGFVGGNGKVAGTLGVSRSFGDADFKKWVIPDPHVSCTKLTEKETHLIVACDGLWDVVTDQEAVDLVVVETDAQRMSKKLLDYAIENESKDNLSIIVILL